MRTLKFAMLVVVLQLASSSLLAWAVPIANLYNTGLDSFGNYQPTGASDGNYTVISSPAGAFTPVATDDTLYPFPFWIANNPTFSRWVGPSGQSANGPAGNYTYRTSFNLPANANLGSVSVAGLWATDDLGLDILINGNPTGQVTGGYSVLVPFSITSNFQVGTNTIDFLFQNAFGPTGLRVDQIKGNYSVPEPGTIMLAAASVASLVMRRCR